MQIDTHAWDKDGIAHNGKYDYWFYMKYDR